jgi:hypothetical protein
VTGVGGADEAVAIGSTGIGTTGTAAVFPDATVVATADVEGTGAGAVEAGALCWRSGAAIRAPRNGAPFTRLPRGLNASGAMRAAVTAMANAERMIATMAPTTSRRGLARTAAGLGSCSVGGTLPDRSSS